MREMENFAAERRPQDLVFEADDDRVPRGVVGDLAEGVQHPLVGADHDALFALDAAVVEHHVVDAVSDAVADRVAGGPDGAFAQRVVERGEIDPAVRQMDAAGLFAARKPPLPGALSFHCPDMAAGVAGNRDDALLPLVIFEEAKRQ